MFKDFIGNDMKIGDYCAVVIGSGKARSTLIVCKVVKVSFSEKSGDYLTLIRSDETYDGSTKYETKKWNLFYSDRCFKMEKYRVPNGTRIRLDAWKGK